jgi:hypothetical protein
MVTPSPCTDSRIPESARHRRRLHNNYYINVPLEATYMDSWSVLPQLLRDLVL